MRKAMIPFLLVAVLGCDKGEDKKASPADAVAPVLESWKTAGLAVGAFAATDGAPYAGGTCQAGQVGGVDAVVCSYPTADAAKAAEDKGREAIGLVTGAAIAHDTLLLVVADRRKSDPEGRTINAVTKSFVGKK